MPNQDPRNRPLTKTTREGLLVQKTDDGSFTLIESATGNGFHSASGAASETREVYLANSGVQARLNAGQSTRVLEVGLGTGLGMLMTLDAAISNAANLDYHAIETDWLTPSIIRQLRMGDWLENDGLADAYVQFRDERRNGSSGQSFPWQPTGRTQVVIHWMDARSWQPHGLIDADHESADLVERDRFDAIYFDPFAPHAASELWTTELLSKMYRVLKPAGILATYSCSREVREMLADVGFKVRVLRGPRGGKRNVLAARREA